MKTWFPLTDYDFYAYLASGVLLIAAVDLAFDHGELLARPDWSFIAITVFVASAYVAGHLIASASSQVLEHWLARSLINAPALVLLDAPRPRSRNMERRIALLIGRYYEPLGEPVRAKIQKAAATALGRMPGEFSTEDIFQVAHRAAISTDHVRDRVSDFRNQYGFCRNIALVAYISTGMFVVAATIGQPQLWTWAVVSAIAAIGMTIRFLKFYAAFTAEVLRTFIK